MTLPPVPTATFVVGLDREEVLRRRAIVRRTQVIGIWFTGVGFAVVAGMAVGLTIGFGLDSGLWVFGLLIVVSMLPLLYSIKQSRARLAAQKQWFAGGELPPYAMRMTPQALELGCEGAPMPVVLPWHTLQGFRQRRRFGQPVLELVLAPGVTASTPGVTPAWTSPPRPPRCGRTSWPSRSASTASRRSISRCRPSTRGCGASQPAGSELSSSPAP